MLAPPTPPPTPPRTHANVETSRVQFFCWQCRAVPGLFLTAARQHSAVSCVPVQVVVVLYGEAVVKAGWAVFGYRGTGSPVLSFILFLLYLPSAFLPQTAGSFSVPCTDLLSPGSSPGHFPTGENHEDLHLDFFYSGGPAGLRKLQISIVFALMAEGKRS